MRIFLSHKAEQDKDRAERIKNQLEGLEKQRATKISVFVSSADIAAAEKWPKRVRSELRKADLLLLLYTDPHYDWAWCMYEAGLYTKLDDDPDDDDLVTFLYHVRAAPPSQLRDNQGVKATVEGIHSFLVDLVKRTTDKPKLTPARKKRVEAAAKAIAAEFPDSDSYHVSYTVFLDVTGCDATKGVPDDALVETTGSTISVFGKAGAGRLTWAEMTEKYRPMDGPPARWLTELDEVFVEAAQRRPCEMIRQTFESHEGGLILHPVLHRVDRVASQPVSAEIAFVAEVAPADVGGPVFAMVRALERNNSEVIEPFLTIAGGTPLLRDDATPDLILQRLDLIESDIKRGRVFKEDRLALFGDEREEVGVLCKQWGTLSGKLTRSCKAKKPNEERLANLLYEMRTTNNALSKLVANRYASLVNERD